jgi:eukaryotic-like serine/threonine-protein kinase
VSPSPIPLKKGEDLGKYTLISELARGGMGVVHLAVLRGPGGFSRLLAVKELRREFLDQKGYVGKFMDEARLAARLNHPNIVQTIEVGANAGRPFLAMEYLDGQPLHQLAQRALRQATRIPLRVHLGVLLDVLSALEYAHGLTDFDGTPLAIVHRDVSPHNVFITYEGHTKLIDFGISKAAIARETTEGPVAEVVSGKMRYMAPEQATAKPVDRRADLFSVGVMLWEAIVGRRPWDGQPDETVLLCLSQGAVPRMRDEWPDVDPGLGAIVERAMSVDPDGRYASALEMRVDLERYIATRSMAPPSARALGAQVSKLFAVDREELRARIESQLRAEGGGDGPRIDSPLRILTPADPLRRSTPMPMTVPVPASGRRDSPVDLAGSTLPSAQSTHDGILSSRPGPMVSSVPSRAAPRRWPAVVVAASAAGFGAALALAVMGIGRARVVGPPPPAVAANLNVARSPVSNALASVPVIERSAPASHVVVIASPRSAQLYLDDVAVSNPFVADRPRDEIAHRLRVEAPGYESKTRLLTFAEDIDLEIDLAPSPAAPARRAVRVEKPAVVDSPGLLPPASAAAPPRAPKPIDTGDPYAR